MTHTDATATPAPHTRRKRVGRGRGSGCGKTSSRGHGGQRSRSGGRGAGLYEGGQMPLFRRLPRRGFNNKKFATRYAVVNVGAIDGAFDAGAVVAPATLVAKGLVTRTLDGVKILGDGRLTKPLTVQAHKFSASAAAKIQAAGGTIVLL